MLVIHPPLTGTVLFRQNDTNMLEIEAAELLQRAIESRTSDVWTTFSGRIETYDGERRRQRLRTFARVAKCPDPFSLGGRGNVRDYLATATG